MADPTRESPESSDPGPRRRRRRASRGERRKRIALLLLLLALGTGAVVLAPGLIELINVGRPSRVPIKLPPRHIRTDKPLMLRNWRFDFSMGPILELMEQGLNLEPFDLRRPLRIPFAAGGMPRGDILLSNPVGYSPSFVPGAATPLGGLPPSFVRLDLPSGFADPGSDIPNGQPDYDPELADGDEGPKKGPKPPKPPKPPKDPDPEPTPEPATLPVVLSALALGAALKSRSRSV